MNQNMTIKSSIISQIEQVARDQKRTLAPLSDELPLTQLGLDSLSIAMLVARLEDEFGFDPFSSAEALEFPVSLGDFIRVYEHFPK
jgi:acyl carrier protein